MVSCPKCGSADVHAGNRGWNWKTGLLGSGSVRVTCLRCGHAFKPGQGAVSLIGDRVRSPDAGWETKRVQGACECGMQIVEGWNRCPDCGRAIPRPVAGGETRVVAEDTNSGEADYLAAWGIIPRDLPESTGEVALTAPAQFSVSQATPLAPSRQSSNGLRRQGFRAWFRYVDGRIRFGRIALVSMGLFAAWMLLVLIVTLGSSSSAAHSAWMATIRQPWADLTSSTTDVQASIVARDFGGAADACRRMSDAAKTLLQMDDPPEEEVARHWRAAMNLYDQAGTDCYQGLTTDDLDRVDRGASELEQATAELELATAAANS